MTRAEIHHQHRDVTGGWLRPAVFGVWTAGVHVRADRRGGGRRRGQLAPSPSPASPAWSPAPSRWRPVSTRPSPPDRARPRRDRRRADRVDARPEAERQELAELYRSRGLDRSSPSRWPSSCPGPGARLAGPRPGGARRRPGCRWPARGPRPARRSSASPSAACSRCCRTCSAPTRCPAAASAAGLFAAGALTARFTARPWIYTGLRQLLIGAAAAAVTFWIGAAVGTGIG